MWIDPKMLNRTRVRWEIDALSSEFARSLTRDIVESVVTEAIREFRDDQSVAQYVPALTRRIARERLLEPGGAPPDS